MEYVKQLEAERAAALKRAEEAEKNLQAEKDIAQASFNVAIEAERKLCAAADAGQELADAITFNHLERIQLALSRWYSVRHFPSPCRHEAELTAMRGGIKKYCVHFDGCGYTFDHLTQTGEMAGECTCGLTHLLGKEG
jgi:hypothetical protein